MFLPSRHDPFEPLDRRWLRAGHLLERGLPASPRDDDAWVGRALAYRTALGACRDDHGRHELADRMPAVARAVGLRRADPPHLRWAVEARVLAREPFDVIAGKCALLPDAVAAYERLFFAVADKLDATTWVMCQVIGPKVHHGMSERDLDVLWKYHGHTYGPPVLDAMIHGTLGPPRPAHAGEAAGALARDAEALFGRKKALAVRLLPVTPETAAQVLQLAAQLAAAGRGEAQGRGGRGVLGAELERLLGAPAPARPTPAAPAGAALPDAARRAA